MIPLFCRGLPEILLLYRLLARLGQFRIKRRKQGMQRQRQRDKAGIIHLAVANCDIDRVAEYVGDRIGQQQTAANADQS
jgi:hypothetical protein